MPIWLIQICDILIWVYPVLIVIVIAREALRR
jgi:hypothetical protein